MNHSPFLHWVYILALCFLALAACAPATAARTTTRGTVIATKEITMPTTQPTIVVGTSLPANQVTFVSWAADSFELRALVDMVAAFMKKEPGIKVNCTITARARVVNATPGLDPDVCKVVGK
jgi:ABC-type glycerol-3-phosphate transport system substrate-binding protein